MCQPDNLAGIRYLDGLTSITLVTTWHENAGVKDKSDPYADPSADDYLTSLQESIRGSSNPFWRENGLKARLLITDSTEEDP